ncbi:Wadjet anti-phage system protein JetD domain-containing protein [Turicibacter sanguinis]|uniref:Wadjet anti-phage system protein JetD domain-containing protein n=1 Tax=Turicibacter sanguinis TaxID=154288 RepID=UPI002E1F2D5A
MNFLKNYPTKKIMLDVIQDHYQFESYKELYYFILGMIENNILKPVKASEINGKKPALHKVYWVLSTETDYSQLKDELSYAIHPRLKVDYYLKNLSQYEKDQKFVLQLSQFLMTKSHLLNQEASLNERSFQIWGREKFLQIEQGRRILKNLEFKLDDLNCYETAEPIAYYTVHKQNPQNILIIENKDTFYSMRKHLLGGNTHILGLEIGTLVYGAGKGVSKAFRYFEQSVEPYLLVHENQFYYLGDLDYEGIGIYESLTRHFECVPFVKAYEMMLNKVNGTVLPQTKERQNRQVGEYFLTFFSQEIQNKILIILKEDVYIPQECLTIQDF